ncbi:M15 family metallopeptidase [Lysobacter silvisoli]|nr:M15 family metallopeptidase [Lysobacter silvisoli]
MRTPAWWVLALLLSACGHAPPRSILPAAAPTVPQRSPARDADEAGMVELRSLVPDLAYDIRYAGSRNFTGRPVAGYLAPRCYLLRPVAEALQRVEASLREQGLSLLIYDCYRPMQAVADFVAWAGDPGEQSTKAAYYPNLDKRELLGDYIAPTSGHSRGATLDLTLQRCDAGRRCAPLDMGTSYDYFDPSAHTDWPGATPQQRANRQRLLQAMAREGFANYPLEWWHYTYKPEPTPDTAYDFPLR